MADNFTKVILRRLRLVKINHNLLVFLVFLVISIIFWFMQSLKETTEVSITYQLKIENLPNNIVFTSEMPSEISVNYISKGWDAFYYKFLRNESHVLVVNYKDMIQGSDKITIEANTLRRAAMRKSPKEMTLHSTTPNKVEVYYCNGRQKRVPVIFDGHITTTEGRYQCGIYLTPESVDVYAPRQLYRKINSVKTERVTYTELKDTTEGDFALLKQQGIKIIPDSIHAKICVDIFTDKTIQVPIYCENVPNNKIMRIFPLKTSITFLVSSTLYDEINADNFLVVADYNEVKGDAKRCKLHIQENPDNIRHLRMSPEYVEYLIEQSDQ